MDREYQHLISGVHLAFLFAERLMSHIINNDMNSTDLLLHHLGGHSQVIRMTMNSTSQSRAFWIGSETIVTSRT